MQINTVGLTDKTDGAPHAGRLDASLRSALPFRLGFATFVASVFLLVSLPQPAQANESELLTFVSKKAAILSNMHSKAKRALVNAAQDRAFASYYVAHDDGAQHEAKKRIEAISLATQSRFKVEEMCLIDASGPEIARIVRNLVAPDSELSPDETGASFFEAAFAAPARHVYVARPYMSPDANKWVLAYATPIVVDGKKKAILHYEHGLDAYTGAVNSDVSKGNRYLLIVAEGGYVISDSRAPMSIEKRGELEELSDYFRHIGTVAPNGLARLYQDIDEQRTGVTKISDGGVEFAVAYAVVEGGLTLMAVERL